MARLPRTPKPARPIKVDVRAVRPELARDLERVEMLARLLDSQFSIAGIRFGWDSIVGLVPVVGDVATAGMALYPVYLAHRHGLSRWTLLRMLANVGIDAAVGAVPVLGDVFDLAFKANRRNLELFQRAVGRQARG